MSTQYQISPWGSTQSYKQYDVINGMLIGGTVYPTNCARYATQPSIGQNPSGYFTYNITSITSSEDIATINFAQTGNVPNVAPGSVIMVAGTANNNYVGMAIAGASGTASFINPGFADAAGAGGTISMYNPAWSSGYFFVPTYTSKISTENQAITTQFGNGYTQKMSRGLNTFDQKLSFVYQNIDSRQMKAISHFVEDTAGVRAFEVMIPDSYLFNQPRQKFTADNVDVTPVSWRRYDVSVEMSRSFNP